MKRLLKWLAFVVALHVALVVIFIMTRWGCGRATEWPGCCDPVPPSPDAGTAGSGPGPATGPVTGTKHARTPPICDPVHVPPHAGHKSEDPHW